MTHSDQSSDTAVRTAGMIATLTYIDGVGFHGIATSIAKPSPTINPDWSTLLRNAGTAVASVTWPEDLHETVETFVAATGQLAAALDKQDIESAKAPAREVHVAYHALSDGGWKHLSAAAGTAGSAETAEGAESHHHGHHGH